MASNPNSPVRAVALLSLFDGLGTARLAIQDALAELGHPTALAFAGFAELDAVLASAVEEYWAAGARAGGWLPYQRLAADVWDLLRQDGGRFRRLCELLPREALTLLIGGSPCQDVSPMGPGRGRMGLLR
jgi:site-specific DNA-cytosine methylase